MASTISALPPDEGPSIGRRWVRANVIAAAILVAIGLFTLATDKLFGMNDPGTGMLFRIVAASIDAIAAVAGMAAYAMFTAAVLTRKLPGFPRRTWMVLHSAIGAIIGLGSAALVLAGGEATGEQAPIGPVDTSLLLGASLVAVVLGALVGLTWGGLQALVIRMAARRVGAWIGLSVLIGAVVVGLLPVAVLRGPSLSGLASSLAIELLAFVATVLAAIVMVPAVNRLMPRV